jgi:hypothetical protein
MMQVIGSALEQVRIREQQEHGELIHYYFYRCNIISNAWHVTARGLAHLEAYEYPV